MAKPDPTLAQRVARAAIAFQQESTGHAPRAATVVVSGQTLVVTLEEALSPAEKALARSQAGAAQVQEFHRQLFASSGKKLRRQIEGITGAPVREAGTEIETKNGSVAHAFSSGAIVQVFLLAENVPADSWRENGPDDQPRGQ